MAKNPKPGSTPAPAQPPVEISNRLKHDVAQSHEHRAGEPPYRRLRIFTSDPVASRLEGRTAVAQVPYEPLVVEEATRDDRPEARAPCVCGSLVEVCMVDADGRALDPPRLDDAHQLLQDGYAPSESNPRFHAQMIYAVSSKVHEAFRFALGREPGWSFARSSPRLRIFPFGTREENAWYDADAGELRFGYYDRSGIGWVFTSLSHDIVAHELTHALLDSQRPHFMEPTSQDVPGFHEGFADLVALFQHFQYPEALRNALQKSRSVLVARTPDEKAADWLCCIARQFGQSDGLDALRRADRHPDKLGYKPTLEEHDMGEVLLSAVFDAFDTVYRRRTARLRRLATAGSGVLPPGELSTDLLEALADEAAVLARQFTSIVVRAIDYCPPADIKLGEYLRAMITADTELRPDDPWAFREALIDAFRVRKILPRGVLSLSEDSLVWGPPRLGLPRLERLSFGETQFGSAPGRPVPVEERCRQAGALGEWLMLPGVLEECGLTRASDPRLAPMRATVTPPCIDALETTRRVAPNGDVHFETVAIVTQRVTVPRQDGKPGFSFVGGGTLLFSPEGTLRLAVTKNVARNDRIERRRAFIAGGSTVAARYWREVDGRMEFDLPTMVRWIVDSPWFPNRRSPAMNHADHHSHPAAQRPSLSVTAFWATLHCLSGCAVGEVLGMVIGTALGLSNVSTIALAVLLAFAFGYAFTMVPLLRAGMGLRQAMRLALLADTVSIAIMELVDNLVMLAVPGAMDAPLSAPLFWGALAFALVVAGIAAFPVNRWLIGRGRGHAAVHSHHHH